MILYYNPECSKCQAAKEMLDEKGCEVVIRNYLASPPDLEELRELTRFLGCRPIDLVRKNESLYQDLNREGELGDEEVLKMLAAYPVLLQRPILVSGSTAVIGRPPELVLKLAGK